MNYEHYHYGDLAVEKIGSISILTRMVTDYAWPCQYEESLIYVRDSNGKVKVAFHDGVEWEATMLFGDFDALTDSEFFFLAGRFASIRFAAEAHIRERQENVA